MFSNLDNFLSGNLINGESNFRLFIVVDGLSHIILVYIFLAKDDFEEVEKDTPKSSFSLENDSWLDSSDTCNSKTKTKKNAAVKANGGTHNDDDDIDDFGSGKEASYVPVKGQKTAAKRLQKIQGLYLYCCGFSFSS